MELSIDRLKGQNLILLECLSGSKAYGLDTPDSDTDIRGVFYMPKSMFYGMEEVNQVSNENNDIVYYELGHYVYLLTKSNPNAIELLYSPEDCILYQHPLMKRLKKELFLSKNCQKSFGDYAMAQIKKARSLNKKVLNPMRKERQSILEFCFVVQGCETILLSEFLDCRSIDQGACGLCRIQHINNMYALYYGSELEHKGIMFSPQSNELVLSSVPKGLKPLALIGFSKEAYISYCKRYKEYWAWVNKRNEFRYNSAIEHGKNYDAKNMMHTFRLLSMAEEIGRDGTVSIRIRSKDRTDLLKIKRGEFEYHELLVEAESKMKQIERIYQDTSLQESPNYKEIEQVLVEIREVLYEQ